MAVAYLPLNILLLFLALIWSGWSISSLEALTHFKSENHLSRFIQSPTTQTLFVAGTNVLLELNDTSLQVMDRVTTGPQLDSPACHASGCSAMALRSRVMTDNYNKVLVLDEENGELISCGSLFQGACNKHDIQQLKKSEFLPKAVAANDNNSSTFAFIGPQRYNPWGHGNVLYVGTTFTRVGDYRLDVPAISSRNLHDLDFAEYSFSKQSHVQIDVKFRDHFLVDYVYGFSTSTHVYFVTVQRRSHIAGHEDKGRITRLARACISDPNFNTYTEVTIECINENGQPMDIMTSGTFFKGDKRFNFAYNNSVLIGTFATENPNHSSRSAVCSFPMQTIDKLFEENIHNCFNGTMQHRNLEYISGPVQEGKCPTIGRGGNIENFCDVGLKISGQHPIRSSSVYEFPGKALSVTVDSTFEEPVIFVGTREGSIIGIFDDDAFQEYEMEGEVKQLSVSNDQLIYLTPHEMGILPVSNCNTHTTCEQCAKSKNPYCTWCPSTSSCDDLRKCQNNGQWHMSQPNKECVQLVRVDPQTIYPTYPYENIYLYMSGISNSKETFFCKFSEEVSFPARHFDSGLICPNPLEKMEAWKMQKSVNLSLVMANLESRPIATKTIDILDCSNANTCSDCSALSSSCQWCFTSQQCLHKSDRTCGGTNSVSTSGGRCPSIVKNERFLIPNDVARPLELAIDYLPAYISNSQIFCMVSLEGAKMKIPAKIFNNDRVICEKTRYKYQTPVAELNATVKLVTADNVFIDETNIVIYKCQFLSQHRGAQDCSLCMAKQKEYRCTWCESTCSHMDTCESKSHGCPRPELFSVFPSKGPLEGGTIITLDGINLKEASSRIKIAGRICPLTNATQSPSKLSCTTGPANTEQNASIHILNQRGSSKARVLYQYVDYSVLGIKPNVAPMSGGTKLTIYGRNLDIGYRTHVFVGNVPCFLDDNFQPSSEKIECFIGSSRRPRKISTVAVIKDKAERKAPVTFRFVPDPVVVQIKPRRSYASGGRVVSIHGDHFSSLQDCQLFVYTSPNETISSKCSILSDELMECLSPPVDLGDLKSDTLQIGLRAANISSLLLLKRSFPSVPSLMTYVPDPSYFNISRGYTVSNSDALVIEGYGIDLASELNDVNVQIGQSPCNVTSITNTQLLCHPPAEKPQGLGSGPPELIVQVGQWMKYNLGSVKFASDASEEYSSEIIGAFGAAAALVIFLAVIILIVLKLKSTETEREYKRIQIQMDILEHNVRSECKEAFADLQTDMTDLTANLETSGIPYFSRKEFLMKVFFPGIEGHPVSNPQQDGWMTMNGVDSQAKLALSQFQNSLLDKGFLIDIIQGFETIPNFGIRDKINFASLLSVFLSTRMDYFSDVIKSLVFNAVREASSGKHPETLFRRTETILEKLLTNWLSITLYDYILDEIGTPLFLLNKAVKYQIEKGPVDQMTQSSKYSLSEEGLLRTYSEFSVINCLLMHGDKSCEVKVLDCDSISQVKSKLIDSLYRKLPYSQRPSVDQVDLEWQCGQDAHVILKDIDLTSKKLSGFVCINTLKHYGVKNKALMSLVNSQSLTNSPFKPSELKHCHLQMHDGTLSSSSNSSNVMSTRGVVPEVYLTRLLATKGTLKKYINDVLFSLTHIQGRFPSSIKWLFDLLDECVFFNQVNHPDQLLHTLKSNCVPLRLWLNLIKNPDMIFDIGRTDSIDNNLSIISQLWQTCCSSNKMGISKDSPPQKLLFAKEMSEYQSRINDYYNDIRNIPHIGDYEFNCCMNQLSMNQAGLFNEQVAVQELMYYVSRHLGPRDMSETYCSIGGEYQQF